MNGARQGEITKLLLAWREGDQSALERLIPAVYSELHRMAHRYLQGERTDHTLQTTALVHEAYLRLIHSNRVQWKDRAHFFAIAAQMMRRILVEFARAHRAAKRGGEQRRVSLEEPLVVSQAPSVDLVALDEALNALATFDARKSKVVELRFFGGMTLQETAEALAVSSETVQRDWRLARAWLQRELDKRGQST